ncbi:MAG: hypothetical protein ACQEP5_10140, partial [Actinomycetota bacterium]
MAVPTIPVLDIEYMEVFLLPEPKSSPVCFWIFSKFYNMVVVCFPWYFFKYNFKVKKLSCGTKIKLVVSLPLLRLVLVSIKPCLFEIRELPGTKLAGGRLILAEDFF